MPYNFSVKTYVSNSCTWTPFSLSFCLFVSLSLQLRKTEENTVLFFRVVYLLVLIFCPMYSKLDGWVVTGGQAQASSTFLAPSSYPSPAWQNAWKWLNLSVSSRASTPSPSPLPLLRFTKYSVEKPALHFGFFQFPIIIMWLQGPSHKAIKVLLVYLSYSRGFHPYPDQNDPHPDQNEQIFPGKYKVKYSLLTLEGLMSLWTFREFLFKLYLSLLVLFIDVICTTM